MEKRLSRVALSVEEAAQALGVGRTVMYDLIHRADFPAIKIGRRTVVPCAELERWLAQQPHVGLCAAETG